MSHASAQFAEGEVSLLQLCTAEASTAEHVRVQRERGAAELTGDAAERAAELVRPPRHCYCYCYYCYCYYC